MTPPAACDPSPGSLLIRDATLDDLRAIVAIEHDSFQSPWPEWSLREELLVSDSVYLCAELEGEIVGYAGMRLVAEEAHIVTIAVVPACRGRGIGEALTLALLRRAVEGNAGLAVLEYRVANQPAAALYEKLGFRKNRIRRGYYDDTGEDAVEAILAGLDSHAYRQHLDALTAAWEARRGVRLVTA